MRIDNKMKVPPLSLSGKKLIVEILERRGGGHCSRVGQRMEGRNLHPNKGFGELKERNGYRVKYTRNRIARGFYPKIGRFFLLVVFENKGILALEISRRKSSLSPLRWKYPGGGAIQNLVSETLPKLHFIEAIRSAPHRDWLALIMPLWGREREGGRTGSPRSQQSASIFHDADPSCTCVCVCVQLRSRIENASSDFSKISTWIETSFFVFHLRRWFEEFILKWN